ncbi:hypothetical protein [Leyella stercorea]|uniref:hypothetical protein n=1 Tax=Leyella stercorea TaxID=363265 RepID=UPI00242E8F90|nr:hypothetical protein [Leyella stercorea]
MTDKQPKTTYRPHRRGTKTRWLWLPSLMFGDGVAVSVLVLTMVMLRRMGLDTADTALAIALLSLPVLLRPLFEMVVTHFWGTTKVWILSTQFISALSLAAVAFTLHTSSWLLGTVCFMPFFVGSTVFYNIALHRFYIDTSQGVHLSQVRQQNPTSQQDTMVRWCDGEMVTLHSSTSQHHNTTTSIMALLFGCGVMMMIAGNMEVVTRNIRYSWSLVFYVMAGVELFLWLWHTIFLPGGTHGYAKPKPTMGLHRGEFRISLRRMLKRKDDITALTFFVLFLLPETLLALTAPLFLIAKPHNGGLGLSPQEFAFTQGTIAVIAIALGYTLGGKAIKKHGLRRWLLPSALLLAVPGAALLFLSYNTAAPLSIVAAALAAGHAALGFALSMVKQVVVRFTRNMPDNTLRHAIARTLIATPFVLVGMFAGAMLTLIDYQHIFLVATELSIASLTVAAFYLYRTRKK